MAYAAYAAKSAVNASLPPLEIPDFATSYSTWLTAEKVEINFHPKVLNKKFTDLSRLPDASIINYNYSVDEILEDYTTHTEEEDTQ